MSAPDNRTPVSIIIPAFNQLDYCRQCVESVRMHTAWPYKLILVDNGSTDGVAEYFDSVPGATVVHTGSNLGFAAGVNRGWAHAEGHVLLLNSDTVVPPYWLTRLAEMLQAEEDAAMIGPVSNCVSGSQQIDCPPLNSLEEIIAFSENRSREKAGQRRDAARLVGFCLLIRDSAAAELGMLDEAYGIGNFEDDDYCMRALRSGWRLCIAEDCFVFHYGSRTFMAMGLLDSGWNELIETNQRIFEKKWQATPEERSDALQESRRLSREAQRLLEAGDPAGAVRLYREAAEAAPFYEVTWNDLGVALWHLGEAEHAFRMFQRALEKKNDFPEARDNLLDAAQALGRKAEADVFLRSFDTPRQDRDQENRT
jgi:GT2 family glycosyltransferase